MMYLLLHQEVIGAQKKPPHQVRRHYSVEMSVQRRMPLHIDPSNPLGSCHREVLQSGWQVNQRLTVPDAGGSEAERAFAVKFDSGQAIKIQA